MIVSPFQTEVFLSCCIILKSSKSRKEHILFACRTKQNQVGHQWSALLVTDHVFSDWTEIINFSNPVLNDISLLWTVLLLVVTSYTPIILKLLTFIHVFRIISSFLFSSQVKAVLLIMITNKVLLWLIY